MLILNGGSIGLYACDIAGALGASRRLFVDRDPERRAIAESYGAETAESIDAIHHGFDIAVEATGRVDALATACRSLVPEGICESAGNHFRPGELPLFEMYLNSINLRVARDNVRANIPPALDLAQSGRVDPRKVVSHVLDWETLPDELPEAAHEAGVRPGSRPAGRRPKRFDIRNRGGEVKLSPPRPGARGMKLFNALTGLQTSLYRLSGGRVAGKWKGRNPILLLEHVGAKSGQRRITPIVFTEHDGDLILVASRGGTEHNPGWFYNLRANPKTTAQLGRRKISVTARVASDDEHERLWPMLVAANPDYGAYELLTERKFPVVLLTPADPST